MPQPTMRSLIWVVALGAFATACATFPAYSSGFIHMRAPYVDGRLLTYSEGDLFGCVDRDGGGDVYRVPYLYASDQSSIPSGLLPIINISAGKGSLNPQFARSAILHDFLYAIGTPGDVRGQEVADRLFLKLQRLEGVGDGPLREMDLAFAAVRSGFVRPNAYGRDLEWNRWADPMTTGFAESTFRPSKRHARAIVVTLRNCAVFDDFKSVASRRLHACLHNRYMSTNDLAFWPPERQFAIKPEIPAPLRSISTPADVAGYMKGDCRAYG